MAKLCNEKENGALYTNSMSVIHIAKDIVFHANTIHINLRYFFICTLLEDKLIYFKKIHTTKNLANRLTKVVAREIKVILGLSWSSSKLK